MKVARWGDSLAVRIPAKVVRALELKEGDEIDLIRTEGDTLAVVTGQQRREAALAQLQTFRGSLLPDFRLDRDDANGR